MPNLELRRAAGPLAFAALGAALLAFPSAVWAQQAKPAPSAGRIASLKLSNDAPIQIESDKLEVRENESKAIFSGNVNVVQGPTTLKSGKMVVYYTQEDQKNDKSGAAAMGASGIDRIEVTDKVYVKSEDQVATGDTGTFDMKTEVLVLSGKEVVLSQGPNVLVGCKLTVQMRTGLANVDGCKKDGDTGNGRVIMSITPGSQNSAQN